MPKTLTQASTPASPGALAEHADGSPQHPALLTESSKLLSEPPGDSQHQVRPGTVVPMDWETLGKMQKKTNQ